MTIGNNIGNVLFVQSASATFYYFNSSLLLQSQHNIYILMNFDNDLNNEERIISELIWKY